MRLCNTDPQINCFTFSHLYVVVQFVWIAAFLVSTKFEHFRCQPPGEISYCCFGAPVLCTGALFCTLFLIRKRLRPYRCRSPPSDFGFAINSNIEIGGNYYEENKSSGLLPVLYTGHDR